MIRARRKQPTQKGDRPHSTRHRRGPTAPVLLILIAGLAAYLNSFTGRFLLDDKPRILENRHIQRPVLSGAWLTDPLKRPLVSLSLAINHAFGNKNPWGYHAFNLAVHLLAGLVLFGLVRRTLQTPVFKGRYDPDASRLALAVALIWTLHPLQTNSVTYVIQRGESMMGLFYLLTIYCTVRGTASTRPGRWSAVAAVGCALGMSCKAVMVTAPLIVLIYDRIFLSGGFRAALRRRWGLYLGLAASYLFMADGGLWSNLGGAVSGLENTKLVAPKGLGGIPPLLYAATQPGVILHYLKLSLWPSQLCLDYWWPVARRVSDVLPQALAIAALLAATVVALVRRPPLGFVGVWFFLILAPTSSIRPLNSTAFEHRMYLSLAAVAALAVFAGHALLGRWRQGLGPKASRAAAVGVLSVVVVSLGGRTVLRNRDYHDELRMWLDIVAMRPENPRAHILLGTEWNDRGETLSAEKSFRRAIELNPDSKEGHNRLAMVLARLGRLDEAIHHARETVRLDADNAVAHHNLAGALYMHGRVDEAILHFRRALELDGDLEAARTALDQALAASRGRE